MVNNKHIEIMEGPFGEDVSLDAMIVPIGGFEDIGDVLNGNIIDNVTGDFLRRSAAKGTFKGRKSDCLVAGAAKNDWHAKHFVFVGAEPQGESGADVMREAVALAARTCRERRFETALLFLRDSVSSVGMKFDTNLIQAAVEGLSIGGFLDTRYKTSRDLSEPTAFRVQWNETVKQEEPLGFRKAVVRGSTVGKHLNIARQWVNDPSNHLTPRQYSVEVSEYAQSAGLEVEVFGRDKIEELGMGLLLGVAQGSVEEPKLLVLRHRSSGERGAEQLMPASRTNDLLALVGKGVTFDSGGISIKPASGMEWMKKDMAGSAAVIGAMGAISELNLNRDVVGIVPMVENMPSGTAIKPGDVLTGAGNDTVEVINTDAEGRLILADALWYAKQLGATHLVDVATLTGACVVALGNAASGLFGSSEAWIANVQAAAKRAGEPLWHLPLYDDYAEQLKSEVADIKNTGTRAGGACTAAAFLHYFAKDCSWAHVDIAGTAWLERANASRASGATGVMLRSLVELAQAEGDW